MVKFLNQSHTSHVYIASYTYIYIYIIRTNLLTNTYLTNSNARVYICYCHKNVLLLSFGNINYTYRSSILNQIELPLYIM